MSLKTKSQNISSGKKQIALPLPARQSGVEATTLSTEDAQRLEVEICWCIQQLQIALKNGKLTPKQVQDHRKAMNALMNNSTPLVKKRQVMRLSFGDYRAKMAAEEKKMSSGNTKIKVSSASPCKNSVFIKRSLFTSCGGGFRFNFKELKTTNDSDDKANDEHGKCAADEVVNPSFHFVPSDNNFRFGFAVD